MPKRDLSAIAQGSSADLLPIQRGRGLSGALSARSGVSLENARRLPLEVIDVNPHQSRLAFDEAALDELAESIRQRGVLQPIGVRRAGERYEILFGERRFRASALAGMLDIPAVIYEDLSDTDAAILTAIENLQREDLDIEDEARQFDYLCETLHLSQRELARMLGKHPVYISRRIRLLKRPDLMEEYRSGRLTLHQAAAQANPASEDEGESAYESDSRGITSDQAGLPGPGSNFETNIEAGAGLELIERGDLPGFIVARSGSDHAGERAMSDSRGITRVGNRSGGKRTMFRWRPLQQFYNWVGRTQASDIPPEARASVRAQLTGIKEALERQIAQLELMQSDDLSDLSDFSDPAVAHSASLYPADANEANEASATSNQDG